MTKPWSASLYVSSALHAAKMPTTWPTKFRLHVTVLQSPSLMQSPPNALHDGAVQVSPTMAGDQAMT